MAELERIRPDRPTVWNGLQVSFGIAPILSTLSELSNRHSKMDWTLYLINVETLIRDRKDHEKHEDNNRSIAQAILDDCSVLAQYIAAYSRLTIPPQMNVTTIVCFYLPHYENVPQLFLKDKMLSGVEEMWKVRDEIEVLLKQKGWTANYEGTEVVFCVPNKKNPWPHKGLLEDLLKYKDDILYRKVLMISHVPSDFHLYKHFKQFNILESYTGKIKGVKELGEKVFKDKNIPWNKYTHLIFGDSKYLKSQILPKSKKQIKELAARNHWNLLPEKQVLQAIVDLHLVPVELLTKPDV